VQEKVRGLASAGGADPERSFKIAQSIIVHLAVEGGLTDLEGGGGPAAVIVVADQLFADELPLELLHGAPEAVRFPGAPDRGLGRLHLHRQVLHTDNLTRCENHQPFNKIFQLAHLSFPFPFDNHLQNPGIGPLDLTVHLPVVFLNEMVHQQGYIAGPFPQGGKMDFYDIEAIVEVFAEPALLDLLPEIAVGRCDDADVDGDESGRPDREDLTVLQGAQQFGLPGE